MHLFALFTKTEMRKKNWLSSGQAEVEKRGRYRQKRGGPVLWWWFGRKLDSIKCKKSKPHTPVLPECRCSTHLFIVIDKILVVLEGATSPFWKGLSLPVTAMGRNRCVGC